jgi:uncharacterized membrane protein
MNRFKTTELKLIGAFFLVAGLYGLVTFISIVFPFNGLVSLLNLIPTLFFALTLYSGYLILLKEDEKGLEYGRAVIALQIVQFHIMGIGYLFVTGGYIFVGVTNLNFGINFGLENTFVINLAEETNNFQLRINVLALAIFMYLSKVLKKIENEQEALEEIQKIRKTAHNN